MNYCKIPIVCELKLRNNCKIMTKEELIQFLKENLKVKLNHFRPFIDDEEYLRVELYLGNERIDWDDIYIG